MKKIQRNTAKWTRLNIIKISTEKIRRKKEVLSNSELVTVMDFEGKNNTQSRGNRTEVRVCIFTSPFQGPI
jgi:hypothetical protein